ncbi:MAG: hypothetical protein AAF517_01870, partial [Planctomycetota bacterium]
MAIEDYGTSQGPILSGALEGLPTVVRRALRMVPGSSMLLGAVATRPVPVVIVATALFGGLAAWFGTLPWLIAACVGIAAVAGLSIALAGAYARASRERSLVRALRNLVQGSHIGLPSDDDLSRALERAARDIEERCLASTIESEARANSASEEREELSKRCDELNGRVDELKSGAEAQSELLEGKEQELKNEAAERANENETWNELVRGLEETKETLSGELAEKEEDLEALEQRLSDADDDARRNSEELETLRESLEEAEATNAEDRRRLESLESELQDVGDAAKTAET